MHIRLYANRMWAKEFSVYEKRFNRVASKAFYQWHDRYYNKVKLNYNKYVHALQTKTLVGLLECVSEGK